MSDDPAVLASPGDFTRTVFLGQFSPIKSRRDFGRSQRWIRVTLARRRSQCPEGWGPMVEWVDSPEHES